MSLTPQFNATTARALAGRTLRVCSTRHTAPFDKNDTVMVMGTSYGSILVKAVTTTNVRALNSIARNWGMPLSALALTDRLESDPPIPEKKPRMSAKKLAIFRASQACLNYVHQTCILMGFDFSQINDEVMGKMIELYNAPEQKKSLINKTLIEFFKLMPAKPEMKASDEALRAIDGVLFKDTDDRDKEIRNILNKVTIVKSNVTQNTRDRDSYLQAVKNFEARLVNYAKDIQAYEDEINTIKAQPAGDLRIKNYDKVQASLGQIKEAIAYLVNTSGFYSLESIQVPTNGDLSQVKIILRTSDVWLTEANSEAAPPMNMGQYLVTWFPYAALHSDFDLSRIDHTDSNFTYNLCNNITAMAYKNNTIVEGYAHPHIRGIGSFCWGNALDTVNKNLVYDKNLVFKGKIVQAFITVQELMKTYNSGSPYKSLTQFRRKQNPAYLKTLELVQQEKSSCIISLDVTKHVQYTGINFDATLINPSTVKRFLNAGLRAVNPTDTKDHCYYELKTYALYHVGTDQQPKEEKGKLYFKLKDNTFRLVEFVQPSATSWTITL
jgi:hypothetical protein